MDAASIAPATTTASPMEAPQHMQALARANRVRLARAALKRSIAARRRSIRRRWSATAPWETESMTLAELLTSQRRWGRTRARKFLLLARAEREQAARHADLPPAPLLAASSSSKARRSGRRERALVGGRRLSGVLSPGDPGLSRAGRRP